MVFWVVTLYNSGKAKGIYYLYLKGQTVVQVRNQQEAAAAFFQQHSWHTVMADTIHVHIINEKSAATTAKIPIFSTRPTFVKPHYLYLFSVVLIPQCCRSSSDYSRTTSYMGPYLQYLRLGHNIFVKCCSKHLQCF
jgi:hypothetical protein